MHRNEPAAFHTNRTDLRARPGTSGSSHTPVAPSKRSPFEVLLDAKATGKKEDNQLFFCEHLPVLTIGKSGKDSNLLIPEETLRERGVSFYHINRGGDITYHGPGQITGYPVFDLEYWNLGLKQYIHMLEETIIRFLSLYDLKGERLEVWPLLGLPRFWSIGRHAYRNEPPLPPPHHRCPPPSLSSSDRLP